MDLRWCFVGYQDSGADIAYTLQSRGVDTITPTQSPSIRSHEGWCFPDTEQGIYSAIEQGATHLWANTILFSTHPLQTSTLLSRYVSSIRIIGQPPHLVDYFDDKAYLNDKLRKHGSFPFPLSWTVDSSCDLDELAQSIDHYPVVGKPIRGRGSHGVKVCHDSSQLKMHVSHLFKASPFVMIEEFLAGDEATITVMPPSPDQPHYWSMPPVIRFNHTDDVAPYNGVVAVTANSRAISEEEIKDPVYPKVMRQCEEVASLIKATAPIRIDVRRFREGSEFALFDINMKPVSKLFLTGCCNEVKSLLLSFPSGQSRKSLTIYRYRI